MANLHRIISRYIIKPANPTPCHLNTYNLSVMDQAMQKQYQPLLLLYPNNDSCNLSAQDKAMVLKKSLSQSLTKYYPFAGRLPTHASYVDCNDDGVVFVEARRNIKLDEFNQDGNLDNMFADDMVCFNSPHHTSPVGVQLNHFTCGGIGLGVSMSHILGDACTLGSFVNYWASVARCGSPDHKEVLPLNPHFSHHVPRTNSVTQMESFVFPTVMRTFVFLNSKLNDLKKVVTLASNAVPTRVEVLTSLLYKTAVAAAATTNSGYFKPSYLVSLADIRRRLAEKLPQTAVGNIFSPMMIPTRDASETSLSMLVGEIKKHKLQLEGIQSVQQATENYKSVELELKKDKYSEAVVNRLYACSSLCGFPFKKVDFGWGKPKATAIAFRSLGRNCFVLMDTPDGDGIQAHVILGNQDMEVFQNNKDLLSFCQIN